MIWTVFLPNKMKNKPLLLRHNEDWFHMQEKQVSQSKISISKHAIPAVLQRLQEVASETPHQLAGGACCRLFKLCCPCTHNKRVILHDLFCCHPLTSEHHAHEQKEHAKRRWWWRWWWWWWWRGVHDVMHPAVMRLAGGERVWRRLT